MLLDPGSIQALFPGPQGLGGTHLTIEEAVEDGHHKTLGREVTGEVRGADLRSPALLHPWPWLQYSPR